MDLALGRWIGNAACPDLTDGDSNGTCIKVYQSSLVSVGLISSVSSIFGAIFIIGTYLVFKDLRTKARFVLLMIAFSDCINALAYIFAFTNSAIDPDYSLCVVNKSQFVLHSCAFQSGINLYATLASNCWTCVLGLHITCLFFRRNYLENRYIMGLAHIVCWVVTFCIAAPAYLLNFLGPGSQSVNVGWCFVSNYSNNESWKYVANHIIEEFAFAKFWEIVTVFILAVVYTVSACKLCWFNYHKDRVWAFTQRHDFRLIWIPFVYFILRMGGHIRWAAEWSQASTFNSCPPFDIILAFLQIIGDTGQGWANAILYILFNQAMRRRIFECCYRSRKKFRVEKLEKDGLVSHSNSEINPTKSLYS